MAGRPLAATPAANRASAPSANRPLYLIDLPGATQSVISFGGIGPSGDSEQYHALSMIVTVVSGRISDNLRQDKGYNYSFSDDLHFRKGPGPFTWSGAVQTSATKESLVEIIKEINDVTGQVAASGDEIAQMEASSATSAFHRFETTAGVAHQIGYLIAFNLGDDYYAGRIGPRSRVTKEELTGIAKQYLKPELLTILVVGDRSKIEAALRSIPLVKSIRLLDSQGDPLPEHRASMRLRKIMHEPSGVVRAFDQVLIFAFDVTPRGREIAVKDRHHVSGQKERAEHGADDDDRQGLLRLRADRRGDRRREEAPARRSTRS